MDRIALPNWSDTSHELTIWQRRFEAGEVTVGTHHRPATSRHFSTQALAIRYSAQLRSTIAAHTMSQGMLYNLHYETVCSIASRHGTAVFQPFTVVQSLMVMLQSKSAELWLAIAVDTKHVEEATDHLLLTINVVTGTGQLAQRISLQLLRARDLSGRVALQN